MQVRRLPDEIIAILQEHVGGVVANAALNLEVL